MLAAPHLQNPLTLPRFAVPAAPATPETVTMTLRPQAPGLEKYARQCASNGKPVKAVPVRPRLCTYISATPPTATRQYHPSGNTSCALSYYLQENCKYRPVGVPSLHSSVESRTGAQEPTNIIAAACGRFHAVVLQEASDHVPHISARTLLSCSTRTPLSLTLRCLPSGKTPQAKVLGAWFYSFEVCCAAPHFPGHQRSHFVQYTSIISLPRNVTHPLSYFSGCTGT